MRSKVVVVGPFARDAPLQGVADGLRGALEDAARDLGFTVIVASAAEKTEDPALGPALRDRMDTPCSHVVSVQLHAAGPDAAELHLRVDGSARVERVALADVSVRAVALLRDMIRRGPLVSAPPAARPPAERRAGRATLMANASALGGLVGLSIQRASGSDDPRLLVPLTLVGAGIGLGASYLASGEWEVGAGDAWYFAAGAWWGTAAGHLVFQGRFAQARADRDRWVFGLVGGGLGATIATLGLALRPMSDAGAIVANGGGAVGLGLGALVELGARRSTRQVPFSGMGYGAGLGWLVAAAVAVHLRPSLPSTSMAGTPLLGVIGESQIGARAAPIVGLGYAGSVERLVGPFPR